VPRVKRGPKRAAARKRVLKQVEGFFLTKSKLYRAAQEALEKALKYAYTGRRLKKRDFRALWITRINAACRNHGISYSKFMGGLKFAGVDLNRKMLSEIAIADDEAFGSLVKTAQEALAGAAKSA
jgi:large subunit ribosomal protein L20